MLWKQNRKLCFESEEIMAKKILFTIITFTIYIITTYIYASQIGLNWLFSLIALLTYILCTFCFIFPEKAFRISHWYINKELGDCSDIYIYFFKGVFVFGMIVLSIISLWQIAPISI